MLSFKKFWNWISQITRTFPIPKTQVTNLFFHSTHGNNKLIKLQACSPKKPNKLIQNLWTNIRFGISKGRNRCETSNSRTRWISELAELFPQLQGFIQFYVYVLWTYSKSGKCLMMFDIWFFFKLSFLSEAAQFPYVLSKKRSKFRCLISVRLLALGHSGFRFFFSSRNMDFCVPWKFPSLTHWHWNRYCLSKVLARRKLRSLWN